MENRNYESQFGATERERSEERDTPILDTAAKRGKQVGDQANDFVQQGADQTKRGADRVDATVQQAADRVKQTSSQMSDSVQETADRAKDMASQARDRASDVVETAKQKTNEASAVAADRVDTAMTATGQQMSNLAETVRQNAPQGKAGELATSAADALQRSGQYLQDANLQDVRTDLERLIREHPIESLLVGLGIGYLLARVTRR